MCRLLGNRRGSSVVETAFMMPWIVFLFIGVLDMGFYSYALITAARAAFSTVISA